MKNTILLCGLIIVIMALIAGFGYTNARYYSTASMDGKFDYVGIIGEISIYQPGLIYGYTGSDDGSGIFDVPIVNTNYENINYKVTNKIGNEINENEASYYIRIVAEDGSNNIPIEYDVHEYNNPNNILNLEQGVGYGPFTLSTDDEETQYYSIKVDYNKVYNTYATDIQHLKVQMLKKSDGTLKVIDDAPLNMEYTGHKVNLTLDYYLSGTSEKIDTQNLTIYDNFTINFKDSAQLTNLGITLPSDNTIYDINSELIGWSGGTTVITLPEGDGQYRIEVYLISSIKVAVGLWYYSSSSGEYMGIYSPIVADRGSSIDFTNEEQRRKLGIVFPSNYFLQGLSGSIVTNQYTDTSVTIPNIITDSIYHINLYMLPNEPATVNISYYASSVEPSNLISDTHISLSLDVGTVIDFTDSSSLSSLGISLPIGYKFKTAYCTNLDDTGTGHNTFTIPNSDTSQTYNIDVVLDEVSNIITVPVKFCDSNDVEISSITVNMDSDGTYDFNTDICRTLCPELNTMTSFTIYIANKWGSSCTVGNTSESPSVTVDYNADYAIKLTEDGAYIYIKAWG